MNREAIEAQLRARIGAEFSQGLQLLGQGRVRRWLLRRGKEFGSPWIWWGDVEKSRQESYGGGPHEGVDFALAEMEDSGRVEAGLEDMRVPVFTAGRTIWCFADLVGDTVIVATDERIDDFRLVIQYSHIDFGMVSLGWDLAAGTDIGRIKLSVNSKSITASHLHVSTALLKEDLLGSPPSEVDFTNWLHWDKEGSLVYLDPLALLLPEVKDRFFVTGDAAQSPISTLVGTGPTKEDRIILRRILARNFPGLRTLSKLNEATAREEVDAHGLLVWHEAHKWRIEPGSALAVSSGQPLSGEGFESLVSCIQELEALQG